MRKNKTKQRLTAMVLSVIMVVGMTPVSALAETGTFSIGTSCEITAFEALESDIAIRSVPLGTSQVDLKLPDTLVATIRLAASEEEPVLDSGETEDAIDSVDTVSGSAIGLEETGDGESDADAIIPEETESISSTDEKIASPSDAKESDDSSEAAPAEEARDGSTEITVSLSVTWVSTPEYDGETAGEYIFTPEISENYTLTSGVDAPTITVTVGTAAIPGTVTAFDVLPDDTRWQNATTPKFPETVDGTVAGKAAQIPVTWEADHDYDAESPQRGLYVFTAVLGKGYGVSDGVELPRITVYIPQTVGRMMARMAGGGTTDSPLEIATAAQLAEIATLVNARPNGLELFLFNDADAHVTLELQNDIDLSSYTKGDGWVPIGGKDNRFNGTFDGGGHKVTNLTIQRIDTDYQGLFGCIGGSGTIKKLGVVGASITGAQHIGGVVGKVQGGTVQNCYSSGRISMDYFSSSCVGGVAGSVEEGGTIENCYSTATVGGTRIVGGVVGFLDASGTVQNCYSIGNIGIGNSGNSRQHIGGMVGFSHNGVVKNCAALNSLVFSDSTAGRVVGYINISSDLSGNIAFGGMIVKDDTVFGGTLTDNNGADKFTTEIRASGFFESLFGNDPAWTYAEGKLPILVGLSGQSDVMPAYITGPITGLVGAGTIDDPYRIHTAADLKYMADMVNSGGDFAYGKYFRLENDIDLSVYGKDYDGGKGWAPIGTFVNAVFDGNGKTITGLYINRSNENNIGLFSQVTASTIQNLFLEGISLHGDTDYLDGKIGGLAAQVSGGSTISGCAAIGSVTGEGKSGSYCTGGLVGLLEQGSTFNNCAFYGTVSAKAKGVSEPPTSPPNIFVGGIAGRLYNGAAVTNCLCIADVSAEGENAYAGGIAGQVDAGSRIALSTALGTEVLADKAAGRIAGEITAIASGDPNNKNYVWSGMNVNGSMVSGTVNNLNGEDTDAAAIQTLWTSGALKVWDTDIWTLALAKLPVLTGLAGQNSTLPSHISGSYFTGAGTSEDDPYLIKTAADLAKLAELVNAGTAPYANGDIYYRLQNDLELSDYASGEGWTPIGTGSTKPFKGTFDGNDQTITGLVVNRPGTNYIGLFGYLYIESKVHNLCISDANIQGKDYVGGIAGYSWGAKVENCAISNSISGTASVGGIVGYASSGTIQNCYSTGSVTGTGNYVGGIIGYIEYDVTTVQNCYSDSSISGGNAVGGIAGYVYQSKVQNCYSIGSVLGARYVGGVAGDVSGGTIQNCYSTSSVTGTDEYVGGIAGVLSSSGTAKNCVALNPSINAETYNFGRVVGSSSSGILLNNYAFSHIPGTWANKGTGAKDGADVTSETLFGANFWTMPTYWDTAAWDGMIWICVGDKLPILAGPWLAEQSGDGGLYLTARDIQYATAGTNPLIYNGSEQIPTITFDGETLIKDTDYTISITSTDGSGASAGINAGTVTLILTGRGSFYGTKNLTYTIGKKTVIITPHSGQSKKYGAVDPVLTFDNNGGLTPGAFEGRLSRGVYQNVGTHAISLGDLSAGDNYELSLASSMVNFTIEQARVTEITAIVDNVNKTAYEMRGAATAQEVLGWAGLPSSVSVLTDGGTAMLPITWSTSTAYNIKGTEYAVTGTLTGNENIDANSITKSITVTVTPVTAVNPTFGDALVVINSDSSATAAELGATVFPTNGTITVEGESVPYTIEWNGSETLDRTGVGNTQTFTGTISYTAPPAWLTLPVDTSVSRKVTVTDKTLVTIGGITTANKTYDGTVYAPTGTVTVSDGFPVNQLELLYESTDGAGYHSSTAPTDAGAYKLTISVPESNANYVGSKVFTFTIEKRQITLTADNKTVVKGGGLPALTYTVGNLAPGETEAEALSDEPTLACPTFDGNTLGGYNITLTGGTATDNYTITTRTNGTLTVAEQAYTVTFNLNGGSRTGGGELTQSIANGSAATAPTVTRSGYTFTGWDKTFDNVTADLTVTASWSYNGGGGGGSSSDSSPIIITPPAADKPNSPIQGEIKVTGTADGKGNITVNITNKIVTDAFDKALAEAKKNGNEQNGITVVLRVDTGNNTGSNVTVNLPKTVQDTIIAKKIVNTIVVVDNPDIRIGMNLATVQEINKQAKSDVNITATRGDSSQLTGDAKKAIGSRPVFDLKVNYGSGKQVQSFGAGSVSVTIPYTLGANEKAGNVQAVYVDAKGKVHWLVNSVYDSVEQVLRFSTNHFSTYGIGYKQTNTAFKDIAGHWAKGDIEFVASRGLFSETSETKFSPNTAMTRGMFVTALGRLANADVSGYAKSSFSDVKGDAYYMGYIEWASKNNIVNGVGNGKFAPDQSITREQMAVIMSNYAKTIGYTLPKVHVENIFADNGKISTYAKEAVKQMQMAGVISGKNGNLYDPQGKATRAEVSAVLRRFVELAISSDTAQGWSMNDSGKWMYFKDGKPLTGKQDIDEATYTFDQYGVTADMPKNLRYTTYIVQKGDSFWLISRKLGCTMSELERLNNKSWFSIIYPGDVLRVPEK